MECRKAEMYEGGDHLILVGRALDLAVGETDAEPLIHHRGSYRRLAPKA